MMAEDNDELADEERIVWLEDPSTFRYVREGWYLTTSRRGPIRRHISKATRTVAYATLCKSAEGDNDGVRGRQSHYRRYWWVAPWDPYEGGGHPHEAVDPVSIKAGQISRESDA